MASDFWFSQRFNIIRSKVAYGSATTYYYWSNGNVYFLFCATMIQYLFYTRKYMLFYHTDNMMYISAQVYINRILSLYKNINSSL
ncbi:hypothetical protein YC2023_050268 [Brassica napus]